MKKVACFDVGGTFIKYGVVDEQGQILTKSKIHTPNNDCKKEIPKIIIQKINELDKYYSIDSVGISTAGKVDSKKGEIIFASENLPGYTGTKLSEEVKINTGFKCFVENDVNSAALAESWRGAGKELSTFVCITLGTGVGGAIIINDKLYKGVMGGSGEIGHMIINEAGDDCNCGSKGCFERYASTAALIRSYTMKLGISEESLSGKDVFSKIQSGEKQAIEVYKEFLNHIVTGLVNITHIFDPGLIVLGGGISAQGKPFFDDLNELFKNRVMPSYGEYTKIVPAQLGNDAGILGACYIALN
ncbi:ROK family protein [Paramaledivibacter caminithermalis]|jgi:glucokinase|uniref:Glucokinase n=1 Tax=Paramaledivibacter caminithermalis (strain DSM 15212 / CIP 107654 / DViRD3) TaxID=1121301 RepID=A0A1M6NQC5_PARC5|nr:ROK family protein [Paramaledivibacter caminithermalis]SHJ97909.1 glucokinase [Paramaledivibacter caminithermalis DSM 15212]